MRPAPGMRSAAEPAWGRGAGPGLRAEPRREPRGGRDARGVGAPAAGRPHVFCREGAGLPEARRLDPQHLRAAVPLPQDPARRLARGRTLLSGATGQPRDSGYRDRVRSGPRGGMGEALISPGKTPLPSCPLLPP